jgi:hypothetical protein
MSNIRRSISNRRSTAWIAAAGLAVASLAGISAHSVKSLANPTLATAFVSSPSAGTDAPIPIAWAGADTGLKVACFNTANTSPARQDDPLWPRVTAIGFELPGRLSGFRLVAPASDWSLEENVEAPLGDTAVTLDFAIVAPVNPMGRSIVGDPHHLLGLPPNQSRPGARFCVSGPFPSGLTIEQILNGVVVRFHGVDGGGPSIDFGVWDNAGRTIPLFP